MFPSSPTTKEAAVSVTLIPAVLSTGKSIYLGRHGYCQPDAQYEALGRLTKAEREEAWELVNERVCAEAAAKEVKV